MESVLLYLTGIVLVLIGLAVSIGLHEIGHLVPAKLFGVKVTQYMIGFGRTIFSRRRGETEYGVKLIPLGGYISMIGMFPPARPGGAPREASTGFLQSFYDGLRRPAPADSAYQRMVRDAQEASAETVTSGDEHRTFSGLPVWKRIVIMAGGPLMNLVLATLLFAILISGIGRPVLSANLASVSACALPATSERTVCEPGDPAAPGAAAGLVAGDRILAIDGETITEWARVQEIIRDSPNTPIRLTIERAGETSELSITPMLSERYALDAAGAIETDADGNPVTEAVGFVGVTPGQEIRRESLAAVPGAVGEALGNVAGVVVTLPQRLVDIAQAVFGPGERDPNGPVSIVGVGRLAGEVVSHEEVSLAAKASTVVGMLASLNLALFVFNLIPLMPLDGGHIAAALWEKLRRGIWRLFGRPDPGPVNAAKAVPVTLAVVAIFGGMSLLLILADIIKPISLF